MAASRVGGLRDPPYVDSGGRDTFETLRLSGSDPRPLLATLERDTGQKIDHSTGKWSFPGIPVRAAIGDRVTVTDSSGQTSKGRIMHLTRSAITLDGPRGASRGFAQADVRRIKLSHSMRRDALMGFSKGALLSAAVIGLPAVALGGAVGGAATQGRSPRGSLNGRRSAAE